MFTLSDTLPAIRTNLCLRVIARAAFGTLIAIRRRR